jgi:hypothetical protein
MYHKKGEKKYIYVIGGKARRKEVTRKTKIDSIKMDLRENKVVWTELVWLRIGTSGGLL